VVYAIIVGMYLRTTKRKNKDGSVVTYYHLAHNVRHPETNQSTPRIIHNFGRADQLDRQQLVRLCRSIARVCQLEVTDPLQALSSPPEERKDAEDWPETLKLVQSLELGTLVVIEALWERLGIGRILREVVQKSGCQTPYERALLAMTANRLCEPESKLGVWDRWLEKVYLPSCQELKLAHMYEAMDLLQSHSQQVEEAIFFQTASLLDLEVDLVFYDTTTVAFSVDTGDEECEDEDCEDTPDALRQYGRPKDGSWSVQMVVALAVTREGLPVRSWVFPGNKADMATVTKVKRDLKGWNLGRALFVGDGGFNSEDNRHELAKACGTYLLATRLNSVNEVNQDVLSRPGRYRKVSDNLHVKEVVVGGQGVRRRRYLLCYNPREAKRQQGRRKQVVQQLQQELARHRNMSATAQWAIELLASPRTKRYLAITDKGQIRLDRKAIQQDARTDGKWVIQTNDDTLTPEDAACAYKNLSVIERCFRTLKSTQLKLEPVYHRLSRRLEAHVKICVMALLIERFAELACEQPWSRIRPVLSRFQATEVHTSSHLFFRRNEPSSALMNLMKKLAIPLPNSVLSISPLDDTTPNP
jgi:transposase